MEEGKPPFLPTPEGGGFRAEDKVKGARVRNPAQNWFGVVTDVTGPKTVTVRSDGGYIGTYDLHELELVIESRNQVKVIVSPGDLLEEVKRHVLNYQSGAIASIRCNKHMNDVPHRVKIDQRVVDAVLVDLLNFIGASYGVDYAINTTDLPHPSLLEKIARAADVVSSPKKEPPRSRGPAITPELRAKATERATKERAGLDERSRPGGGRY